MVRRLWIGGVLVGFLDRRPCDGGSFYSSPALFFLNGGGGLPADPAAMMMVGSLVFGFWIGLFALATILVFFDVPLLWRRS
ncbi:hypothetical protein TSUD_264650 [Trifolium subterraneum]|uniref:Uncharacterized protein n=1 Tax=Trifolium subterraneum TaxID=3900 RepID=A0A2Z6NEU2_TRISU|nr:hypothetical protein TSUD_264650 [Trifolium subterraneum]